MTTNPRADLVLAINKAASWEDKNAAVEALASFDREARDRQAEERSIDLANTVVARVQAPGQVFGRHTVDTDWLGEFEAQADGQYHEAVIAEASLFWQRTSAEVKADKDEFGIQAQGLMRRVASQYGDAAPAAERAGLEYLAFLWRQAASGLDQVQQTIDSNNAPKTTPLDPTVFDNFAPEVDPINAGVVGTETSERAPLLQEIESEGNGSAAPEKPGGHSTTDDFSGGYSEVPATDPASMVSRQGARANDPGHEDCPSVKGQSYSTSTGDCSCGSNHNRWASSNNPNGMKQGAYVDAPSMAIGYAGSLPEVLAQIEREGASGLPMIEEIVDANNQPHPEAPGLPTEVAFPWEITPDAYGNGGQKDKTNDVAKSVASLGGEPDPFSSAPEGARTAGVRSTKPMVAGEGAYLYNPHDSGQKHSVSPGTNTTPGQRYVDMFGEHADHKVEGLPGEWQLGGEWHHHDGSGTVTGSLQVEARQGTCAYCEEENVPVERHREGLLCKDCASEVGDESSVWDASGKRKDGQGHPDWRPYESSLRTNANYGIAQSLYGMKDGDEKSLKVNGSEPYKVTYHSEQAMGDNGKPAKGFHTGSYGVEVPGGNLSFFRHTPHGPGLTGAQPYAADQAARHIVEHFRQNEKTGAKTAGGNGYATWSTDNADWHDVPDLMHEDDPGWDRETAEDAKRMTQEEDPNHAHDLEVRPYTHPNKRASRKTADMFGNSDSPHAVMDPGVANSPSTTPNASDGYAQGKADGLAGRKPTTADGRMHADYARGFGEGVAEAEAATPKDVPSSLGGDNGQSLASAKFVKASAHEDPDFRKGYGFAMKWQPGKPLVSTGSGAFESGLYAGITDHTEVQGAWLLAHQRLAAKDPQFATRMTVHAAYTKRLDDAGIFATASDYPLECYSCGKTDSTGEAFFGNGVRGRKCPDCGSEEVHSPDAGKNWGKGKKKTGATSTDLDTTGPASSPDPGGMTPINGPGTTPPLAGQADPAASAGAPPYQGAPPYGSGPVVPTSPAPSAGPHTVDDVLGGPIDGNARATAFRRKVQAGLLVSLNGQG